MKIWKPITAIVAAAVVYGAAVDEVDESEVDSSHGGGGALSPGPVAPSLAGEPSDAKTRTIEAADGRLAIAVVAPDGDDPEDEARQDALSTQQRVRALRGEFRSAVEALRDAADSDAARRDAESALSALRGEMYATASGRAQHQRFETELDTLLSETGEEQGL